MKVWLTYHFDGNLLSRGFAASAVHTSKTSFAYQLQDLKVLTKMTM